MRLINVDTRLLEDYVGNSRPNYAILSHTREEEEMTYAQDIGGEFKQMKGFGKINMTCRIAKGRGISHGSSAELSEAINSMFRWYRGALECYAYLSDLHSGADWKKDFPRCRWFTQGWTFQELIAPRYLSFLDSIWDTTRRGDHRSRSYLAPLLSNNQFRSDRTTTKLEDMAYFLLGIFDVNMPLLYGEGEKAFIRLQEEIMRSVADLSILAWSYSPPLCSTSNDHLPLTVHNGTGKYTKRLTGVLATSPGCFRHHQRRDQITCKIVSRRCQSSALTATQLYNICFRA
ncbi:uncharacterized protein M421DRAFT_103689 [Didymella exigua CBS 183.55]|uniref:DUF8212 domain-containing protein n=1 Tax=Didymella exigua CBS 183.55 TaxID=1150837 RepID=A0A6A5R9Y5_9PLEO|nr:uncharacterized protein M421DRAFT_103689 [Didymella exigua CBS 183.55]KAF1924552.1 hypothetical protein M421DRAFT_103689 [Didymella exigua CBS 183.55]